MAPRLILNNEHDETEELSVDDFEPVVAGSQELADSVFLERQHECEHTRLIGASQIHKDSGV